jgi:hypothetical protein
MLSEFWKGIILIIEDYCLLRDNAVYLGRWVCMCQSVTAQKTDLYCQHYENLKFHNLDQES